MERNEEKITDINIRIEGDLLLINHFMKECISKRGYDRLISKSKMIIAHAKQIINSCEEVKELEKPKYKEGSYYWVNDGDTWKPAKRGYKSWHFIHYAAREEDVKEVGEEITRN